MPVMTTGGMVGEYGIELRKADGTLVYQEASVMFPELPPPPAPPTCYAVECINAYKRELDAWARICKDKADLYQLIHAYHRARSQFCQRHRNEVVPEHYRTGTPVPTTVKEIKIELEKLGR